MFARRRTARDGTDLRLWSCVRIPLKSHPIRLSNGGKIGPDQVCVGRPSGLGRPGPDWDNRNFECPSSDWDGPAGWVVPARPGLSHLAGLSQFGWVVSLGWVVPVRLGLSQLVRLGVVPV